MLLKELKTIETTEKVLKKFGFLLVVFLTVLGSISFWQQGTAYYYLFPSAMMIVVIALAFPKGLKLIYLPWMIVATIIGWAVTRIILTILYYAILTPVSILARVLGKDFLDQKIVPEQKSYWVVRANRTIDRKELEHQF